MLAACLVTQAAVAQGRREFKAFTDQKTTDDVGKNCRGTDGCLRLANSHCVHGTYLITQKVERDDGHVSLAADDRWGGCTSLVDEKNYLAYGAVQLDPAMGPGSCRGKKLTLYAETLLVAGDVIRLRVDRVGSDEVASVDQSGGLWLNVDFDEAQTESLRSQCKPDDLPKGLQRRTDGLSCRFLKARCLLDYKDDALESCKGARGLVGHIGVVVDTEAETIFVAKFDESDPQIAPLRNKDHSPRRLVMPLEESAALLCDWLCPEKGGCREPKCDLTDWMPGDDFVLAKAVSKGRLIHLWSNEDLDTASLPMRNLEHVLEAYGRLLSDTEAASKLADHPASRELLRSVAREIELAQDRLKGADGRGDKWKKMDPRERSRYLLYEIARHDLHRALFLYEAEGHGDASARLCEATIALAKVDVDPDRDAAPRLICREESKPEPWVRLGPIDQHTIVVMRGFDLQESTRALLSVAVAGSNPRNAGIWSQEPRRLSLALPAQSSSGKRALAPMLANLQVDWPGAKKGDARQRNWSTLVLPHFTGGIEIRIRAKVTEQRPVRRRRYNDEPPKVDRSGPRRHRNAEHKITEAEANGAERVYYQDDVREWTVPGPAYFARAVPAVDGELLVFRYPRESLGVADGAGTSVVSFDDNAWDVTVFRPSGEEYRLDSASPSHPRVGVAHFANEHGLLAVWLTRSLRRDGGR